MATFESQSGPTNSGEILPEQKPSELIFRIRQALESKESTDSLHRLGNLLYETFKAGQYTPEMVLSSVREIYEENKDKFEPKINFNSFIQSFGPGLVKLCQQKLVTAGGYNLGKYGEKKDGVDGKLGKMTSSALRQYYEKKQKPKATGGGRRTSAYGARAETPTLPFAIEPRVPLSPEPQGFMPIAYNPSETQGFAPPNAIAPGSEIDAEITPYQPGTELGHRMSLGAMRQELNKIYERNETTLNQKNLAEMYGRNEEEVKRFITLDDPILGGPISFLGRPINYTSAKSGAGVNLLMIPFLKIAEDNIRKSGINYQPKSPISGFKYRTMTLNGKQSNVLSHHAYGLAIDIDPSSNDKGMDRGDIPDEVILAMAEAGFAWGSSKNKAFSYLGDDPMHFQLRFDARDPQAQAIIRSSPVGIKYWNAILPLLPEDYRKSVMV